MTNQQNNLVAKSNEVVELTPDMCNRNLGKGTIAISIRCKRIKDANKKLDFNSVKGYKRVQVINDDSVNEGIKGRWIDVHFTKDAFKSVPQECGVHSADDLTTGVLYVQALFIQSPRVYKVTEDDETGELKYPQIWIKGGIIGFEPLVDTQEDFNYVPTKDDKVIDAQPYEVISDEPETSETTIE